jgi:anti-sigma B factor antagonist
MQIEEKIIDDVAVLVVSREVMTGPDVAPFHDRVKALATQGVRKVVVDFSGVPWFGSPMLGALIGSVATLRKAGGDIRLAGLTERMLDILRVSHLTQVFKTMDTTEQGVASFRG